MPEERSLQGGKPAVAEPLHGRDIVAGRAGGWHQAGAGRRAVHQNCAGTAIACVAAHLGAGQAEVVAQDGGKSAHRLDMDRDRRAVDAEGDVDAPEQSPLFQKYPTISGDHHLLDFITDYLRMMSTGNINVLEMQDLMDEELTTHHAEESVVANALQKMADGLPAFGIVAAVMGVVHTMGSVGAPPAILGEMIAAALVGTFLGILLSYGFIGPLADLLHAKGRAASKPFQCVKAVLLASLSGYAPSVAVEFGRKVLFTNDRPTFKELDDTVRATKVSKPATSS